LSRVLVLDIFLDKGNLFGQFSLWPITYWRTSTGREVAFILGDKDLALEIKGSARIHEGDITALQTLLEDGPVKKCCLVCLEKQPRRLTKNIEAMPWPMFIERLWGGNFG
jgi:hypothetical protein